MFSRVKYKHCQSHFLLMKMKGIQLEVNFSKFLKTYQPHQTIPSTILDHRNIDSNHVVDQLGPLSLHRSSFWKYTHHRCRQRYRVGLSRGDVSLVVFLEAWNNAQVRVTLWTVVFRLPAQYPSVGVDRVPAVVAAQCGAWSNCGTVAGTSAGLKAKHKER